ncbi:MAG: hypothetical protein ACRDRU_01970, partial [Pseudonocardiaceae bacterium]
MAPADLGSPVDTGLLRRLPVFVLPLVIALAQLQGTRFAGFTQPERTPLDALAFALLVAGPVALLARRRYPVPAARCGAHRDGGLLRAGLPLR